MTTLSTKISLDQLHEYIIRPAMREDAQAILDLYVAADAADHKTWAGGLEDVLQDFDNPGTHPEEDTRLAFSRDGQLAAVAWVFVNKEATFERRAFLWGVVHPDMRGRGLGSALLSWMEGQASRRLKEYDDGIPQKLVANSVDSLLDRTALYEQHGFHIARYYFKMRRDLSQPIPDGELPEGYRLVEWSAENADDFRYVINESFKDHWGFEPIPDENWRMYFLDHPNARHDLSFGVSHEGRLVAETFNRVLAEDNAREGVTEGWIGTLGVLREERGKGLASYLLCESMRRFKGLGFEYAGLSVDAENLTGALRLYEKLGFRAIRRFVMWKKDPIEMG